MGTTRTLFGVILAVACSFASIGSSGEAPPSGDALCSGQTMEGVPRTLDKWSERARLFAQLGDFTAE